MAITPKQERNGHPAEPAGGHTPPGPYPAIPMDEAMNVGVAHMQTGHAVWQGGGFASSVSTDWAASVVVTEVGGSTTEGAPANVTGGPLAPQSGA